MRFLKSFLSSLEELFPIPKTLPPVTKQNKPRAKLNYFGCLLELEKRRAQRLLREQQFNQNK